MGKSDTELNFDYLSSESILAVAGCIFVLILTTFCIILAFTFFCCCSESKINAFQNHQLQQLERSSVIFNIPTETLEAQSPLNEILTILDEMKSRN